LLRRLCSCKKKAPVSYAEKEDIETMLRKIKNINPYLSLNFD
jgi:hypothetical protein